MDDIEKLGRYNILRVLGKGAMGVVYEGLDPNLDRAVALKTIRMQGLTPEAAAEYEGRFRTEARSAARLHHPNIVSVFDSGHDGDVAYLVMEFIEGEDLKQHLESGARFSVRSSIVMVHELLMALDHAHRQNVVHRDIKPANMLMEVSGRVKLTDFGVARIQEPNETNLTQVGGAVGTPKYMSPEQAKGLRGDSRSDLFSAAVVLYELLTGTLPFTGENQLVVIHQIVGHHAAPPSSLNPDVPAAMDEVMARAMAKNPDERYATAREFALALRAVAQQMQTAADGQPADVAAELAAHRPAAGAFALRDGSSTGLFGPNMDVVSASTVNHEAEFKAWQDVKDTTDPQAFLAFLKLFPSGIYARRAQNRVYQLGAGAALEHAKTEPQFKLPTQESGFDSTVGHYAATRPLQTSDQTVPSLIGLESVAPEYPVDAVAEMHVQPAIERPKRWPLFAAIAAVVAVAMVGLRTQPSEDAAVSVSAVSQGSTNTATVQPTVPPTPPATEVFIESTPSTVAAPANAGPKPHARTKAPVEAISAPAEPRPAPTHQGPGVGPSAAGQVCADKVFVFKVKCIADQCATDRFRHTQECLRFKEMEREGEEQRKNAR